MIFHYFIFHGLCFLIERVFESTSQKLHRFCPIQEENISELDPRKVNFEKFVLLVARRDHGVKNWNFKKIGNQIIARGPLIINNVFLKNHRSPHPHIWIIVRVTINFNRY